MAAMAAGDLCILLKESRRLCIFYEMLGVQEGLDQVQDSCISNIQMLYCIIKNPRGPLKRCVLSQYSYQSNLGSNQTWADLITKELMVGHKPYHH